MEHRELNAIEFFTLKWLMLCKFYLKKMLKKKKHGKDSYKQQPSGDQSSGLSSATYWQ